MWAGTGFAQVIWSVTTSRIVTYDGNSQHHLGVRVLDCAVLCAAVLHEENACPEQSYGTSPLTHTSTVEGDGESSQSHSLGAVTSCGGTQSSPPASPEHFSYHCQGSTLLPPSIPKPSSLKTLSYPVPKSDSFGL